MTARLTADELAEADGSADVAGSTPTTEAQRYVAWRATEHEVLALDRIIVIGIFEKRGFRFAFVRDAEGVVHRVTEGGRFQDWTVSVIAGGTVRLDGPKGRQDLPMFG